MASPSPAIDRRAAETWRILALAWPVALTSLNWTLLHVTDVILVGLVSTDQVAILGASRTLLYVTIVAGLAGLSGILVFTSRADGAGDLPRTGRVLREGLLLALLIGLGLGGILFVFAAPLLRGIGVAVALVPGTARVVQIMAIALPIQLIQIAASFFLEGVSRPQRVTTVNLAILPINAVLAWMLSGGHCGFPVMGAEGAALATAIAAGLSAAAMLGAVWLLPQARARGVRALFTPAAWAGAIAGVRQMLGFGIMPAVASGLELAGFSILIALSTQFGDATAHAFQIVFSIHNVTFAFAMGLGSAAGVRAGNAVGEGMPGAAIPRTLIAVILSTGVLGTLALLLIVAGMPIIAFFPATADVHQIALVMLPVWAPFILFDGIQLILVYALRSMGDQVITGVNSILAYFIVTGGVGWWLVQAGVGSQGLVYASGIGMVTAATLHSIRFWQISRRVMPKS
jgi:MATE family multidrug resistance protein